MNRANAGTKRERLDATRRSLVGRLVDLDDRRKWQEFFDTYWRLIYGVARRSGLTDAEAQDVVQETVITVSKNITKYECEAGSFKSWLLRIARWRIVDQVRKREPAGRPRQRRDGGTRGTATIERVPGPEAAQFEACWEEEWKHNLFELALERVKRRVSSKQYQIFDCVALKRWPVAKVAATLDVNIAQVYLAKHRVAALLKKEVAVLEKSSQ
jgi:RNA polymerase sigma factor (sigma-70 family)